MEGKGEGLTQGLSQGAEEADSPMGRIGSLGFLQLRAWLCTPGYSSPHGVFSEETLFEGERELAGPQAGQTRSVRASIFMRASRSINK